MPIQGLPQFTLPGQELAEGSQSLLQQILQNRQAQARLAQEKMANEQLNQYRMGELGLKKEIQPSEIAKNKAMEQYYLGGGGRGGVNLKNQMALMQQAIKDNPGMTLEQANMVTSAWLNGEDTLPDGSPVPQPSGNAKLLLDINQKGRTTAGALNNMLNAQGAEKEVETLSNLSNEWMKPYGTTYLGMSPSQIMDSFKNDDASQDRLGKFIAAQALQYDIAPARSKLAGATPGVTLTNELVNVGMQNINAKYPRLSQKAREAANKYINEALNKGFEARKKAGIGASSVFNKTPSSQLTEEQINSYADNAIAKGAPREKVEERRKQLLSQLRGKNK